MMLDANVHFLEQAVLLDNEELACSSLAFIAQQILPNKDILPRSHHLLSSMPRLLTAHDGSTCLKSALSVDPTRYPHPIILGCLMKGLGCTHNILMFDSLYFIAQKVLFLPYFFTNPTRQTEVWFQIEDWMIITCAHAGNIKTACMHHDSITAPGAVTSCDAFGSLIKCETTDNISNTLDLFMDSVGWGSNKAKCVPLQHRHLQTRQSAQDRRADPFGHQSSDEMDNSTDSTTQRERMGGLYD